ncbi:activating signal cointegrator 1 isoform X2 [Cephus cinctus]|uniref:Activating signal cointegrator 1 isoform X2 n=1 Tax=Cephus cinctus TaxID=211228 RepID=A0AAJ7R7L0_CEPCN|nr:activating signal cointegrator 1 isoform X2 [Cephus cinctus]
MEQWVYENLSSLLDFPVPADLTQCILQMRNERDLDEYLQTLLDYSNPKHRQFIIELKKQQATKNDLIGYKKLTGNNNVTQKQNEKKKGKVKGKENLMESMKIEKVEKPEKKKKFVNLYSQEGRDRETILLKVCAQEGAGPCFFCNELVCSPDQQAILSSNSKQADNLYNKLMEQKPTKELEDSMKHRNKLLEYDRNSARRTKVIDDESDYYQANSVWLSNAEREKLQKQEEATRAKKHGSRLNRKVILDLAGREVIDEFEEIDVFNDQLSEDSHEMIQSDALMDSMFPSLDFEQPVYVEVDSWTSKPSNESNTLNTVYRIQDREYLEMVDEGLCLSMHQPYASLLVAGIKVHEGRSWYSAHRGRLWIAAATKVPNKEEISALEHRYRVLLGDSIKFPNNYPTGCLLGYVNVVDVLPQEEYRRVHPEGDTDSPFVFICEDCKQLPIKFPMQGKHKIYKLDKKIHQAAVKSIERISKIKGFVN